MRSVVTTVAILMLMGALAGCVGADDEDPAPEVDAVTCEGNTALDELNNTCYPVPPANGTEDAEPWPPWYPSDGASIKEFIELPSTAGHMIPVTVYKPAIASADVQFPVLLQSHGFTGSRMKADDAAEPYVAAGFGVVSFDERGHGDAKDDSKVMFMHPTAEVMDVITVVDYIASLDWVLMEPDTVDDPLVGGFGYSYAGAMQLMGSIFDQRIDALVPEMTWNSITESLAPNGAIKSGWVDLFYIAGNAQQSVVFSDDFHAGWAWAVGTNELPAGQAPMVPDLVTLFDEASPASYPGQLDVPTRLIQGMPDTLFPLNQAVANYEMLNATGTPVQLYTNLGGHVLHTSSLYGEVPGGGAGLQGSIGGNPCGTVLDLTIGWHQAYLLNLDVDLGPNVCISLEDETTAVGDAWPLPNTDMRTIDVGGPWPMAQAIGGNPLPLYTVDAAEEMVVAGIPRLAGTITSPGPDAIVYFSFQKVTTEGLLEHIVDDQVIPLRITGPNTGALDFDMELGGIGTRLLAGEQMVLMASSAEPMYFGNTERIPTGLVLDDLTLQLPVVVDGTDKA